MRQVFLVPTLHHEQFALLLSVGDIQLFPEWNYREVRPCNTRFLSRTCFYRQPESGMAGLHLCMLGQFDLDADFGPNVLITVGKTTCLAIQFPIVGRTCFPHREDLVVEDTNRFSRAALLFRFGNLSF